MNDRASPNASQVLDRVLVLEMVRVTEAAAVAASKLVGRGDEKSADAAAVEAMRQAFDELDIDGTVVIGEGERDEAPMLFIGEKVGGAPGKGPKIDIALDHRIDFAGGFDELLGGARFVFRRFRLRRRRRGKAGQGDRQQYRLPAHRLSPARSDRETGFQAVNAG